METIAYLVIIVGSIGGVISVLRYEIKHSKDRPVKPLY